MKAKIIVFGKEHDQAESELFDWPFENFIFEKDERLSFSEFGRLTKFKFFDSRVNKDDRQVFERMKDEWCGYSEKELRVNDGGVPYIEFTFTTED